MEEMNYIDLHLGQNATLDTDWLEESPQEAITSSSYEFTEGADDSPYIVQSSLCD